MPSYTANFENDTTCPITLAAKNGTYRGDGNIDFQPTRIRPNGLAAIRLSTIPDKVGGGIDAGNVWVFNLPSGQTWTIATGYGLINGQPVTRRVGVVESSNPEEGAKAATDAGNKITSSETFQDDKGNRFSLAAEATLGPTIIIRFTVVKASSVKQGVLRVQ
ncbi:hypothetical protein FRB90_011765 [Tulasnella sp. 427]|nr:hypothetical protein FRB90_011765 [Tulasnella sp. 427]